LHVNWIGWARVPCAASIGAWRNAQEISNFLEPTTASWRPAETTAAAALPPLGCGDRAINRLGYQPPHRALMVISN